MDFILVGKLIQPWATTVGVCVAAVSLWVGARSLRLTYRANKAKFVYDLTDSFFKDPAIKEFWYRLDYDEHIDKAWKFDLTTSRHSEDERKIDTILYKLSVVGHMLRTDAIAPEDASKLYIMCRQVFVNKHVQNYLRFLQLDFYCAYGFTRLHFENALYAFIKMSRSQVASGRVRKEELKDGLRLVSELKRIGHSEELRQQIAASIGYKVREPPVVFGYWSRWGRRLRYPFARQGPIIIPRPIGGQQTSDEPAPDTLPRSS